MGTFKFNRQVFLGNGEHSVRDVAEIHKKVDYAVMLISGLQQPPHSDSEEAARRNAADQLEGEQELQRHVRQIVRALTGKEIDFK